MPRPDSQELPDPSFHEPVFRDGKVTADPAGFLKEHPSDDAVFAKIQELLATKIVAIPKSRHAPEALFTLAEAYGSRGSDVATEIANQGRIVFHAVGDTGVADAGLYRGDLSVADQLTLDCKLATGRDRPAFMLHLGDVVYNFGESQFYYDQFYAPYRGYPAPIFAIPGNHDSFVLPGTATGTTPLDTFMRNFCAGTPVVTREAASLHRTAMTQPGVYFALEAPFVRILCLFSNALEDPGVISGKDAPWEALPSYQLDFLAAQLHRIKAEAYAGALLIAVHHPPFNYVAEGGEFGQKGLHGPSRTMLRQIDEICAAVGVYPHAFISGHAHNYQRYSRSVRMNGKTRKVPFIVCGAGGHQIRTIVEAKDGKPAEEPRFGADVSYLDTRPAVDADGLVLEKYNDSSHGYLRIGVDAGELAIAFHLVGDQSIAQSRFDKVIVDLASRDLVAS